PSPLPWAAVQALECDANRDAVSKANTMYGSKVEIRVTYWLEPEADIDVGAFPIDRSHHFSQLYTWIGKNNPANASGTIHSIKIWVESNIPDLIVGTFYTTNGDTLKCRDSEVIGAVEAGAE
ncbi:unnamed protein product, partial [marine sediment metagenome]